MNNSTTTIIRRRTIHSPMQLLPIWLDSRLLPVSCGHHQPCYFRLCHRQCKTTTTTTTIWQQPQRQRRIIDQQQNNIDNVRNEISSLRMSQRLSILEADPEEFRRIKAEFKKSGMTTAMGAMQFLDQQMMTQNINLAACRSHD
mmetsp:Transcript_5480/g.7936  ORF Transcript_5480/g.7936 Transcript_5480/m.7936 type:complete len:143 (+) Transcript_5480:353-781(+)